jgi:hypothetical protein
MARDQRRNERVVFQKGFEVHVMAIDGTWRRTCILKDVSEEGAKLIMEGSIEGLQLREFFLPCLRVASPTAAANSLG